MNAENFAEYLKNPALLYQLSYEELKTLALQYPYSQNIQYLLLIKSKLDNHKDYSKNLARAAASMTDRTFLYRKIKELKLASVEQSELISNEEVLELRELSELEEDIREKIPINLEEDDLSAVEQELNMEFPTPSASIDDEDDEEIDFHLPQNEVGEAVADPTPEEQEAATGFRISQDDLATLTALAATLDHWSIPEAVPADEAVEEPELNWEKVVEASIEEQAEPTPLPAPAWEDALNTVEGISEILEFVLPRYFAHIPAPAPLPKAVFRSWKRTTIHRPIIPPKVEPGAKEVVDETPIKSRKKTKSGDKKKKKLKVREIAAASVEEHDSIASETLAKLLESQGQYDKAIAMYERLITADPEKSDYFKEIIDKIKSA